MKVGSLFSGIGGLDLGLERAGMTVCWQSEIDPYASRVLAKHWPTVPNLGDVTLIDWSQVEPVDLICGGYPCQPFSLAGVRRGESDPRHLWPHFARAIRLLRPRLALLENVPGHLSMGFGRVLGDLAELGYHCEWECIPAAAVGAPHLRYRVFVIAHTDSDRYGRTQDGRRMGRVDGSDEGAAPQREWPRAIFEHRGAQVADTASIDGARPIRSRDRGRRSEVAPRDRGRRTFVADTDGMARTTTSVGRVLTRTAARRSVNRTERRGRPGGRHWAVEPDVGRVAHGIPSRVDRLRCLGNAVVPQVAQWIGEQIMRAAA